eukprot:338238-Pleurochrysis_carterae.AAC.1
MSGSGGISKASGSRRQPRGRSGPPRAARKYGRCPCLCSARGRASEAASIPEWSEARAQASAHAHVTATACAWSASSMLPTDVGFPRHPHSTVPAAPPLFQHASR